MFSVCVSQQVRRLCLCLGAVLGASTLCLGAEEAPAVRKVCVCPLLRQAPEMDGEVLEDSAWQPAPTSEGFVQLHVDVPASRQSSFRLGFTEEALYVGVVCAEPKPDAIAASMADGEPLWEEDSVEVFLSPDGITELQFVANPVGNRASPHTLRRWEAAGRIAEGQWSIEFKLPWEVLGAAPAEGENWGLNVCRNILPDGERELTTWAQLEQSFHEPQHFGEVRFDGIDAALRDQIRRRIEARPISPSMFLYCRPGNGLLLRTDASEDRIAFNQGSHVGPRFSPDGEEALASSLEGGKPGVWRIARGGAKERLCDGAQANWSCDGARILFVRDGRIVEREPASGDETMLSTSDTPRAAYPGYLPGGGVLFVNADTWGIWQVRDGQATVLIAAECHSAPRVSPDGRLLAYQDGAHVYVMDLGTGVSRQATLSPGVQAWPVWAANSEGLCYLQAASPHEELWDLYHLELTTPGETRRIARQVFANFDWNGAPPVPIAIVATLGGALQITGEDDVQPVEPASGSDSRPGEGPTLDVENDWFRFHLERGGALSLILGAQGESPTTVAFILDIGDTEAFALRGWEVPERDAQRVCIRAFYETTSGAGAALQVEFRATAPLLTFRVEPEDAVLRLKTDLRYVIVPDRFADDLVVDPFAVPRRTLIPLPEAPVVLGCAWGADAVLALICPSAGQETGVRRGADLSRLDSLWAAPGGHCIHLGVLAGEPFWLIPRVRYDDSAQTWHVRWQKPFQAQWRFTAEHGRQTHSCMWNEDLSITAVNDVLDIAAPFPANPERSVVYAWGRDLNTPLQFWTPEDVLLAALGIDACAERLDVAGLRGYRSGEPPVPIIELATRPPEWRPWMSHQEKAGFGILEIMAGIFATGTPGTHTFLTHMGEDAIGLIRGLDSRITEYERFLEDTSAFLDAHSDMDFLSASLESMREAVKEPTTDIEKATEVLEALQAIVSTDNGEALCNTSVFQAFARCCRSLLEERQKRLALLRTAVRQARGNAGLAILQGTAPRERCEALRREAEAILQNRYYLEGDWRGEMPLSLGGSLCDSVCP